MTYLGAQNSIALGVQGIIAIDTGTGAPAVVTDPYWANVSMLLHGDGTNAAQNNTFLDGSTNNFTVTRNGNTTQGSFNPFVSTYPYSVATNGGSAYFDGTGDYLSLASNAALLPGAGDFTFECWVLPTTTSQLNLFSVGSAALGSSFAVYGYPAPSSMVAYTGLAGSTVQGPGFVQNVWNHIAVVRLSNNITVYTNGVGGTAVANSQNLNESTVGCYVGAIYNASVTATPSAYISNARFVKGTAIYTANFTPPTAPLTAVTNTALLLGFTNGAIYDNAELNNLETVGTAQISTSVFKYGTGSVAVSGASNVLSTPSKTVLNVGAGDFTVECWVYVTSFSNNNWIFGQSDSSGTAATRSISAYIDTAGGVTLQAFSGSTSYIATGSSGTVTVNTWAHVACVRDGVTTRVYVSGVQRGTASISTNVVNTSTYPLLIGDVGITGTFGFNGYIDDFRFTKGICRYPSGTTFTPPTAAFPNS